MHYLVFALGIALSILAFAIFKRKRKNNEVVDMVLISLLITMILELLTFNYSTYCYYGDDYATKTFTEANGGMTVSKQNNSCAITINNVNTKIRNFYIDYTGTPDKANNINVSFSDEASTNTDAKDKGQVVVPKEEITKYIKISPAGKVGTLTINLGKLKNPDGSDINGNANTFNNITVSINKRIPIFLSIWRMLAVFALLFLIQLIVKYKYLRWGDIKPGKRKMIFSTILVLWVVGMWLLSTTYITDTARKEIFQDVNYDTKDEYHLLTLAMAKGQTNLDGLYKEPERINQEKTELAALKKMENPYMFGKRANMKYKWDVAYYNNHYYTYYGPVPVVLVFLPFYLLTGSMLGTRFFTLIVAAIIAWLMCRLVLKITEQRKELNAWTVIGLLLGFLAVTQIPSCFRQASFYELSPMMSVMFGLGGINIFYSQSKKKKQSIFKIIIGALSMALAVGCKASGIMYSIVIVPFIIKMLYNNGSYHWGKNKIKDFIVKIFNKDNIKFLVAIAVPYAVVGVLLMIYNAVRFGSPFDFGINYQLTVYYVKYYSIKAVGKLPSVIFSGLLQLPKFTAEFPFVHPSTEHTQYMGNLFTFKGWIGAFCYPLTWVLVMLPWSLKRGIKAMKDKAFVITSFATGLFILYMIITVGGISLRYTIEALFLLFIPIIYIVMDLDEACARLKITKYFVYIWMALVFVALFMCVGLLLSGEWNNSFSEKPETFYNLWKSFTFWR